MATRKITRTRTPAAAASDNKLIPQLKLFLGIKAQSEFAVAEADRIKADLSGIVESEGYEDENGHYWLDLPEPVECQVFDKKTGSMADRVVKKLKRQKTVTENLDLEQAEKVLTKLNLLDECSVSFLQVNDPEKAFAILKEAGLLDGDTFTEQRLLDEEAIGRAFFKKKITKADLRRMYPQSVTWSFRPQYETK